MRPFLAALLLVISPADATESRQCRVRAEVWEVGNAAWASALDTMESPGAWRQSLLLAPGSRLAGSWVLSFAPGSTAEAHSTRERIFPVEYVAGGGLSGSEPREPRLPARPDSLLGMFEGWLRAKAHKDFEVRDEGWDFKASCQEITQGRILLKAELSEGSLRDFVSFGFNPLAMPQPEFQRFSIRITRSVEAGRWAIAAAQSAPPGADGKGSGSQRVLLVLCDLAP
jgi:hypothetical protein